MEQIGIRELRQHASQWVAKAKAGMVIVITERGKPVARLAPLAPHEDLRSRLIADGELTPATAPRTRFSVDSLVTGPPLTPVLDELRADR